MVSVPITKELAASLIAFLLNVIFVGALLLAAVLTTLASVKVIFPVPELLTSAAAAVLT